MAMRISGLAAGIEKAGASTEAGFTVGEVTVAGTMALSVFSAFFGIYGGLAYRALRSWLPESRVRRGLVLGTVFLATFGPLLIESVNPDFHLFGPPLVNLCTFSSLFFLFGAIVVPLTDRLDRAVRKQTRVAAVRRAALCLLGVLAVVAMFRLSLKVMQPPSTVAVVPAKSLAKELIEAAFHGFSFRNIVISGYQFVAIVVLLYVLIVVPVAAVGLNRKLGASRQPSAGGRRTSTAVLEYAVLAIPVIVGLALNYRAIVRILQGAG